MKKLLTITVLMALAMSGFAQNQYDFSAVCESGQTLYYRITDSDAHTVILTHPYREGNPGFNGDYYQGFVKPEGEIIIPSVVTYNGADYTVTAIDSNSFWMCIITSVYIPNTVSIITPRAFGSCVFLESISIEEGNPTYYSESNVIIRREDNAMVLGCKTSTIPDGIEIICRQAIYSMDYSGVLTIPNSVRIIEDGAFAYNSFSGSLALPESLETLGSMAFYASGFSGSLTMPNSVTEIGNHAFYGCHFSGSLTLSSSLSTIENCAFADCHFSGTLVIPNSVNLIVGAAFAGNDFSELVLGESVATIESIAFLDCNNLTGALRLPASLTQIDQLAFKNTSFNEIYSPNRMPPTLNFTDLYPFAFDGYDPTTPIHIPFGCTEAYQNASGWNYFTNFIEEAPILYTDFEPDLCVEELSPYDSHDTLKIDLDQDGTIDFKMYIKAHYSTQVRYVYVTSSWDFRYCYNSIYSYGYMDENDSIIPNHPLWAEANDTWELLWYPDQYMEFIMGFRKTVNDENYYAWARIYMYRNLNGNGYQPGPGEFDIVSAYCDDMAYCTLPDYPLRWGQTEIETPSPTPIVPDLYTIGYKDNNSATRTAKLYKNNALLHSIRVTGKQVTPYKIANDSEGNIYWMVVYSANSSTLQTEIWKNDELYLSTEGQNGVTIKDLYCLGDTLFYVGNTTTEEGTKVATVWRGPDFTPHWVLGDGQHDSFIYDADVDKNTHIPYFCGYITDSLNKASVWKASQLFYKQEPSGVQRASWAKEISVDNGSVYTNGYLNYDTGDGVYSTPTVWKDNVRIYNATAYDFVNCLYANQEDFYFTYYYPHGMYYGVLKNGNELLHLPLDQSIQRIYGGFDDIYMVGKTDNKGSIWKNFELLAQREDCDVIMDILAVEATDVDTTFAIDNTEWYYEILNDDGSITYQHLECVGDTLIGREGKRPKVIVRSNTHYDRNEIIEVTHEYVYEENGVVYWWNKDLQEFTTLYNLNANAGNTWEIKVGTESLTMHVDAVENIEYEGHTYRMLHVSDSADVFSGNILCNIGHQTSFFPERLMTRDRGYRVEGMRCYWVDGELVYKTGNEDCDAIYAELHNGIEEDGPSTGSETAGTLLVYPNPTTGVLFVETRRATSLPAETEYRITNLIGQTLLQGHITNETQQINIEKLPAGMYFITIAGETRKFVVR